MIKKITFLLLALLAFAQPANAALPPAQVFIVTGSNINMVSRESKVPVSIQNNYDRAVKVRVHARSTNAALNVNEFVSVVIPAKSRKDALLQISVIANGDYTLKVWVTTFTDIRIGKTVDMKITANPDIELVILVSFGGVIALLVGLGAFRMLARRKVKA